MHGFRKSFIEWSMDRILFFSVAKGKKEIYGHRVQIFRSQMEPFVVYYFQLCGFPQAQDYPLVLGEMQKAYQHMQERFLKKEENIQTYLTFDEGFEKWLFNRRKQNFVKKPVNKTSAIKAKALVIEPTPKSNPENCLGMPNERINKPSARFPVSIAMPGEFHDAYKHYSTNMTSEEAQKELLDA